MGSHWITFGTITRAHGVRGELRVVASAPGEPFPETPFVRLRARGGEERVLRVESARPIHAAVLLTLEGITDREAARELAGWSVDVDESVLPPVEEGELYVYQLEGATVIDRSGRKIGTVARLLDNHGQDLLEIDSGGQTRLLPFVDETVIGFDREQRVLTVQPIPGLWEDEP